MGNQGAKSPLNDQPMRQAGQSTREKMDKLFDDEIMPYFLAVLATLVMAIFEWLSVIFKSPPQPITVTFLFSLALILLIRKLIKTKKLFWQMKLGEQGELAVGQFLEEKLRPMGFQVFHDILGKDFNVDHFVVGPAGLYCIETKTHSKPERGECRITYDGETVSVNGFKPDRDPIVQAKAEAKWVSDLIAKSTGKKFFVQPVVIYPGWFVEKTCQSPDVWVLNEKALPKFMMNARNVPLSNEDVSLITMHLKLYVSSKNK